MNNIDINTEASKLLNSTNLISFIRDKVAWNNAYPFPKHSRLDNNSNIKQYTKTEQLWDDLYEDISLSFSYQIINYFNLRFSFDEWEENYDIIEEIGEERYCTERIINVMLKATLLDRGYKSMKEVTVDTINEIIDDPIFYKIIQRAIELNMNKTGETS